MLAQDSPVWDVYLKYPAPSGREPADVARETFEVLQLSGGEDVETQLAAFCSAVSAGEFLLAEGLDAAQASALYQAGLVQSGALRLAPRGERTWPEGTLLPHVLGLVGPHLRRTVAGAVRQRHRHGCPDRPERAGRQPGRNCSTAATAACRSPPTATGVVSERVVSQPEPGASLVLTVDADLQRAVQAALESHLTTLQQTKAPGSGREACAGAAVMVDVQTGGILAAASAPGYDLSRYRAEYAALSADPGAPLLDRTAQGLYAPGSAFKPALAAAALSAGLITPQDTVNCTGTYRYYPDYQPHCLQIRHGGAIDLFTALKYSCNIYFYDVGRRLGADAFAAAAQTLGLAADTGVEVPEAAGRLTWSEDENFTLGLTLQAAIGQGNTAVTPLQLAAYAAALAHAALDCTTPTGWWTTRGRWCGSTSPPSWPACPAARRCLNPSARGWWPWPPPCPRWTAWA